MPSYAAIRDVPQTGLTEWESAVLNAIKENVEILMGSRVGGVRAVTTDVVAAAVVAQDNQQMKHLSAQGVCWLINGQTVADCNDFGKLMTDVQQLAKDVYAIQNVLNTLISVLRS